MNWTVIRLVAELCIASWILWQLIRRQQQQDVHEQLVEVRASRDRLRRVVAALPHGGPWEDTRALIRPSDLRDVTPIPTPQLMRLDA